MVNTNGADTNGERNYNCECCKFERDGMLCCHVLKIFTHVGVDSIPQRYILRRRTPVAADAAGMGHARGQNDVMPEESREHIRFANLSRDFVGVAKLGSKSDQAEAIARRHIREMHTEFAQLNKVNMKKSNTQQTSRRANQPSTSAPNARATTTTTGMPPPMQTTNASRIPSPFQATNAAQQRTDPEARIRTTTVHTTGSAPTRARRSSSGLGPSTVHPTNDPVPLGREQFVILNPPKSNTKGRKKGIYLAGIEL